MQALTTINRPPRATHRYSVIWLHGLGADGHDFEDIVPKLQLHADAFIHFIFPNAPIQAVTVNGGMAMRAWYDIVSPQVNSDVDTQGIARSVEQIKVLIAQEMASGIPSDRILLAGFSQGGVIALQTGLCFTHKLAGIIALSTYLPTLAQLDTQRNASNGQTPIFMAHGILDSVIDIEIAKQVSDQLQAMGYPLTWHDYVMDHSVCSDEIHHLASFINALLAN